MNKIRLSLRLRERGGVDVNSTAFVLCSNVSVIRGNILLSIEVRIIVTTHNNGVQPIVSMEGNFIGRICHWKYMSIVGDVN